MIKNQWRNLRSTITKDPTDFHFILTIIIQSPNERANCQSNLSMLKFIDSVAPNVCVQRRSRRCHIAEREIGIVVSSYSIVKARFLLSFRPQRRPQILIFEINHSLHPGREQFGVPLTIRQWIENRDVTRSGRGSVSLLTEPTDQVKIKIRTRSVLASGRVSAQDRTDRAESGTKPESNPARSPRSF